LPPPSRAALRLLAEQIDDTDAKIAALEQQIVARADHRLGAGGCGAGCARLQLRQFGNYGDGLLYSA
jgi:hypothetical protein